jgi:hypothetical protein
MIVTPEDVPPDGEGRTSVRVLDGQGREWHRLQWVNIATGQALQLMTNPEGELVLRHWMDEDRKRQSGYFSRFVQLPLPIRFEFLGGERDGAEWKPYPEGPGAPAER